MLFSRAHPRGIASALEAHVSQVVKDGVAETLLYGGKRKRPDKVGTGIGRAEECLVLGSNKIAESLHLVLRGQFLSEMGQIGIFGLEDDGGVDAEDVASRRAVNPLLA